MGLFAYSWNKQQTFKDRFIIYRYVIRIHKIFNGKSSSGAAKNMFAHSCFKVTGRTTLETFFKMPNLRLVSSFMIHENGFMVKCSTEYDKIIS